jgi:hypothetical protein
MTTHESTGQKTFDLRLLGSELDVNSRGPRYSVLVVPFVFPLMLAFFLIALYPRIEQGTLPAAGWLGILIVFGAAGLIFSKSRHMFWGSRKAAVAVTVGADAIRIEYPEGTSVRMKWDDPGLNFELEDITDADPSRKVLSAQFFLTERQRTSALSPEAYTEILATARSRSRVSATTPRRSWMFPGVFIPTAWTVQAVPPKPDSADL